MTREEMFNLEIKNLNAAKEEEQKVIDRYRKTLENITDEVDIKKYEKAIKMAEREISNIENEIEETTRKYHERMKRIAEKRDKKQNK